MATRPLAQIRDHVFCGSVIHATQSSPLEVLENAALGVKDGKVVFLDSRNRLDELLQKHGLDSECVTHLNPRQFVMPGLVDCHIHSPQLSIQALGTDKGLLDWLLAYTFPAEARYADPRFARHAHTAMVRRTLRNGTTSASYYSTIHTDTSLLLCQAAEELGQRALVGKCNIDRFSPDYYKETTEQSIADTKRFVKEVLSYKSSLVSPVVTPRFAVSCSERLMTELAEMATCLDLPVQTHMSETLQEIDTTLQLFPGCQTYTDVYDSMGLLGPKTILAHCVHISDTELDLLIKRGCGVVHCACSNTTLRSGLMDLRRQLKRGVKMGLGTDVGGGYTTSMLAVMRHSVDASNLRAIQHQQHTTTQQPSHHRLHNNNSGNGPLPNGSDQRPPLHQATRDMDSEGGTAKLQNGGVETEYRPLTMDEAFRLATLGGSSVLGQNCGNFETGREFDAILVDPEVHDTPLDLFPFDSVKDVVLKFLYYGDDRNMVKIYVQGREVVNKTVSP